MEFKPIGVWIQGPPCSGKSRLAESLLNRGYNALQGCQNEAYFKSLSKESGESSCKKWIGWNKYPRYGAILNDMQHLTRDWELPCIKEWLSEKDFIAEVSEGVFDKIALRLLIFTSTKTMEDVFGDNTDEMKKLIPVVIHTHYHFLRDERIYPVVTEEGFEYERAPRISGGGSKGVHTSGCDIEELHSARNRLSAGFTPQPVGVWIEGPPNTGKMRLAKDITNRGYNRELSVRYEPYRIYENGNYAKGKGNFDARAFLETWDNKKNYGAIMENVGRHTFDLLGRGRCGMNLDVLKELLSGEPVKTSDGKSQSISTAKVRMFVITSQHSMQEVFGWKFEEMKKYIPITIRTQYDETKDDRLYPEVVGNELVFKKPTVETAWFY